MTKGELNTLVRKVQNECGLESPTKITYYWNEENKLVFKLFFESLSVPEELKIEDENIQNMFTVNDPYLYEDDFLIKNYNTEYGYVEVIPNDQDFKVVNTYRDLSTDNEEEKKEESVVRLAGKRLNEKVARARGYILYEAEDIEAESDATTTEQPENTGKEKAAANSTSTAYMCGDVIFIGKDEKDKLINVFNEWIKYETEDIKDLVKKIILKDSLDSEEYSIVKAICKANVNVIVAGVSKEDETESSKYCTYDFDEQYVKELVAAANKEKSEVLLAPNTTKPEVLNSIQKEETLSPTLNDAWRQLQTSAKTSFELVDGLAKELATDFTSEKIFGATADMHTPFTAAFMEAQTGKFADAKKEVKLINAFDWTLYKTKVPEMQQALEAMKNLTANQNLAINWVAQQAANMQVATIDEETRLAIKEANKDILLKINDKTIKKSDLKNAVKIGAKALDVVGTDNAAIKSGNLGPEEVDAADKPFGITGASFDQGEGMSVSKEKEKEKEKKTNLFDKKSYFDELLKAYCLTNRDKFDQIVNKISVED